MTNDNASDTNGANTTTDITKPPLRLQLLDASNGDSVMMPLGRLKYHKEEHLPPVQDGERLAALKTSLQRHGQKIPIHVDENDVVWDGRSRCEALKELGRDQVLACRIQSMDGPGYALSSMQRRELNLLERIRFVLWASSKGMSSFPLTADERKEVESTTRRDALGHWLKLHAGWFVGGSGRNLQKYISASKLLDDATPEQMEKVRKARSIHAVIGILETGRKTEKPAASTKKKLSAITKSIRTLSNNLNNIESGDLVQLDQSTRDTIHTVLSALQPIVKDIRAVA
jgi:hypothetical protein